MDSNSILFVGNLIDNYAELRATTYSKYSMAINTVIKQNASNCSTYLENFKKTTIEIAPQFERVRNQIRESNRLTSAGLNLIKLFSPGETMHSYLLAYLLNPRESHGQRSLFLNVFLKRLGVENLNQEKENWRITAETARIDILLRRTDPHSVIIIENKSNLANDQPNQLYRYWYQEIYKPLSNRNLENKDIFNLSHEHYQLLYLVPEHWKTPSENSLTKPAELEYDLNLPDKVPMICKQIHLRHDIVEWLRECYVLLPESNYRIKEFISQYIEYWTP